MLLGCCRTCSKQHGCSSSPSDVCHCELTHSNWVLKNVARLFWQFYAKPISSDLRLNCMLYRFSVRPCNSIQTNSSTDRYRLQIDLHRTTIITRRLNSDEAGMAPEARRIRKAFHINYRPWPFGCSTAWTVEQSSGQCYSCSGLSVVSFERYLMHLLIQFIDRGSTESGVNWPPFFRLGVKQCILTPLFKYV